jgi:acyl-CoA thioesterase FadM
MYPVFRLYWQLARHRTDPALRLTQTHTSHHICWPWDLDIWRELNNGRTLTLYDLGRVPMSRRLGTFDVMRARGWGLAVAGASVRYRQRIRAFDRITMRSRSLGWDDRFLYVEQAMWKSNGVCASHVLIRSAITGASGIVPPVQLAQALGWQGPPPVLPDWVQAWIAADARRPWPPMPESDGASDGASGPDSAPT